MSHLNLSFLGTFQAQLDAAPLTQFRSAKVEGLLAYLAIESGQAHRRTVLAALLWPEETEANARRNLRQALYLLQQVLGRTSARTSGRTSARTASHPAEFLIVTRDTVQFNPASDHILDVALFLSNIEANALQEAVRLYHGELLAGLSCDSVPFEEWLYFTRERLHNLALSALHELTEQALSRADYAEAQAGARRQIALEPWREGAHRQLMLALALGGEPNAARAQYESCRRALAEELGAEPDAETTALFEQIDKGLLRRESARAFQQNRSHQDWGEAPTLAALHGREDELRQLSRWLIDERCRLVALLGMGGIGKTALAAWACRQLAGQFDVLIWRSLINAPPLAEVLQDWLTGLSDGQLSVLPESLNGQLNALFELLRQRRCLLVLDNCESIMQGGDRAGRLRAGYEAYGQLFKRMGEMDHTSGLLLTSRELPYEAMRLERETPRVRHLSLEGVSIESGQAILKAQGLTTTHGLSGALVERYSGNPLALMLVGETIRGLFDGDVDSFLGESSPIFDDIRDILDQQFTRLPVLEQEILLWLAIEREACSLPQLRADIVRPIPTRELLEAVNSLRRRSLLQAVRAGPGPDAMQDANSTGFALQNVVTEYLTDYLVDHAYRALETGELHLLKQHALLKAGAREYVRQTQSRLMVQPLAARMAAAWGRAGVVERCQRELMRLRAEGVPSYAAGNLLNLLLHLNVDLTGFDLSHLSVWQAYLRGADLQQVDFSGADLHSTVFNDYVGSVLCVAFSPDGDLLAASADNGAIYLWQMANLQLVGVFSGHRSQAGVIAFSADGRWLVSGGDDSTVRIWEVNTRQLKRTLIGHAGGITSVQFHPDGTAVVSAGTDQTIRVWQADTGQLMHTLHEHTAGVSAMAFSPDGATLASSGFDQVVRLWDWQTKRVRLVLHGHTGPVVAIAYCPRALAWNQTARTVLASGSHDQTLRLWDADSGDLLAHLAGHTAPVTSTVFNDDGTLLMSGSDDQSVFVWRVADVMRGPARTTSHPVPSHPVPARVLQGHFGAVNTLAVQPRFEAGRVWLVSGSFDRSLRLWDVHNGQASTILRGHSKWLQAIVFEPDGGLRIGGSDGRTVRVWDGQTGRAIRALHGHRSLTEKLAFRADGKVLASASWDKHARIWDVESGQTRQVLRGHTAAVLTAVVGSGPEGRDWVATGSLDQTVRLWDLETGAHLACLAGHRDRVVALAFHPDGTRLASASWDGTVALWDLASGERCRELEGHTTPIECVAFHPSGRWLASGSWDGTVLVWDVQSGAMLHKLTDHTNGVEMVTFSPDGRLLAGCACDHLVCVWEVQTGRLLHKLKGHTSWVRCVAFSPDSKVLVSGGDDGVIRFWDTAPDTASDTAPTNTRDDAFEAEGCLASVEMDDPYSGMRIAGITGITEAQRSALKALGAVE